MSDKLKGLYGKYRVERTDGKPLKGGCIVLEFGDPNSWPAINQFAMTVRAEGYEALADDLQAILVNAWQSQGKTTFQYPSSLSAELLGQQAKELSLKANEILERIGRGLSKT